MTKPVKRIGVLTGGGDAPGLNAVIRAVVKSATNEGIECVGLEDSFDGLIYPEMSRPLTPRDVTGILRLGGTILGTTNKGNPFAYPVTTAEGTADYSVRCVENFHKMGLDALVVIGGDGTLAIAYELHKRGGRWGWGQERCASRFGSPMWRLGFETGVSFGPEAIDGVQPTAEAHHRVMVVEVMGRYAGWIALYSGIGGGADVILIPEIPYDINKVVARIRERDSWGARFSIVVVAEGAHAVGGEREVAIAGTADRMERLGGIGAKVSHDIERLSGKESRHVVLGHLQRGGSPTSYDRVLATRFGAYAVEALQRGESGGMVALKSPDIVSVPIEAIVGRPRNVPVGGRLVRTGRHIGICFGD